MSNKAILPPDPEEMNDKRAAWAASALAHFQLKTGTDDEDALHDLLCNLRHWADRAGENFEEVLNGAMQCYKEEVTPWPDDEPDDSEHAEISPIPPHLTRF